jgi:hypothetical protein
MPLQRAVELDAMADKPFAVVNEQPQVELGPVQVRGRKHSKPSCSAARATLGASIASDSRAGGRSCALRR